MTSDNHSHRLILEPESPQRLANLCGRLNEHICQIEQRLLVKIQNRGNIFVITGSNQAIKSTESIIKNLYQLTMTDPQLNAEKVHLAIQESTDGDWLNRQDETRTQKQDNLMEDTETSSAIQLISTPKCSIKPRSNQQNEYVRAIMKHDINFGIGPAGTGKTYLAVACAVEALLNEQVSRILLVRPAVEAGEKLGFLPGDLAQKVDPYLRPLYDALYEMLGFEKVAKLIERNVIEIAPLAYMRGRTLNNSFIILDESQ
ncbi:PhoH family protein, partial [Gammaproteobacteria bacterium]|nr:PhoH family protein [Gammaproteobacteria bacterium]